MTSKTINGIEYDIKREPASALRVLTIRHGDHDILVTGNIRPDDLADLGLTFIRAAGHPGVFQLPKTLDSSQFEQAVNDADQMHFNPVALPMPEFTEPDGVTVRLGDTIWRFDLGLTAERLAEIGDEMPPAQRAMIVALLQTFAEGLD